MRTNCKASETNWHHSQLCSLTHGHKTKLLSHHENTGFFQYHSSRHSSLLLFFPYSFILSFCLNTDFPFPLLSLSSNIFAFLCPFFQTLKLVFIFFPLIVPWLPTVSNIFFSSVSLSCWPSTYSTNSHPPTSTQIQSSSFSLFAWKVWVNGQWAGAKGYFQNGCLQF